VEVTHLARSTAKKKKAASDGGLSSHLKRLISELSLEKLALKDISSWGTCS